MTELVLADKLEEIYHLLDVTTGAIEVLEESRKEAGILFPVDQQDCGGKQDEERIICL